MWAYSSWFLHRDDWESSEVPSHQSLKQHQTHLDTVFKVCTCKTSTFTSVLFIIISAALFRQWIVSLSNVDLMFVSLILVWLCHNILFQLLERDIIIFVKNELKNTQNALSSDSLECSMGQWVDDEDEEQMRSSKEAFLKITLHFLKRQKQQELADCLHSSKRSSLNI